MGKYRAVLGDEGVNIYESHAIRGQEVDLYVATLPVGRDNYKNILDLGYPGLRIF